MDRGERGGFVSLVLVEIHAIKNNSQRYCDPWELFNSDVIYGL